MWVKTILITLLIFLHALCQEGFSHEYPTKIGLASWYGKKFHGRKTASGRVFDMYANTAAHNFLPFGTIVRVVNLRNGRDVFVKIIDRGPSSKRRIIDLSHAAANAIGLIKKGIAKVRIEVISTPN